MLPGTGILIVNSGQTRYINISIWLILSKFLFHWNFYCTSRKLIQVILSKKLIWGHPFSTYAKFFEKLCVRTNGWPLLCYSKASMQSNKMNKNALPKTMFFKQYVRIRWRVNHFNTAIVVYVRYTKSKLPCI